jgi:hypothetical protein
VVITDEVVKAAAGNYTRGMEVMELLLDRGGDNVVITDEVVKAAAGNSWSGMEVMKLLFDRRRDDVMITDEVVKAAAGNDRRGMEVMKLHSAMDGVYTHYGIGLPMRWYQGAGGEGDGDEG